MDPVGIAAVGEQGDRIMLERRRAALSTPKPLPRLSIQLRAGKLALGHSHQWLLSFRRKTLVRSLNENHLHSLQHLLRQLEKLPTGAHHSCR